MGILDGPEIRCPSEPRNGGRPEVATGRLGEPSTCTFGGSLCGTRDVGWIVNAYRGLNDVALAKVEELRADYERVTGKPFYCPLASIPIASRIAVTVAWPAGSSASKVM